MKRLSIVVFFALALCRLAGAQEVSVSTNMADLANFGTFNLGASYAFARHWSAEAALKYNPFSFGEGDEAKVNRQRTVQAGARWWPWHIYSGWWVGGNVRYQEYSTGGFSSPETSEGDRFGGGIRGGYSYMLSEHVNLDLGLGVWAGYDIYRTYACPVCGRVLGSGSKYFILPSDLILSVAYIF